MIVRIIFLLKYRKLEKNFRMIVDRSDVLSMQKIPSTTSTASDCEIGEKDDVVTSWRAVTLAGVVTFLAAVENTVVGMAEWPYMNTVSLHKEI